MTVRRSNRARGREIGSVHSAVGFCFDQHHVARVIAGLAILFEPGDHVARFDVLQLLDGASSRWGFSPFCQRKRRIEILGERPLMVSRNLPQELWRSLLEQQRPETPSNRPRRRRDRGRSTSGGCSA